MQYWYGIQVLDVTYGWFFSSKLQGKPILTDDFAQCGDPIYQNSKYCVGCWTLVFVSHVSSEFWYGGSEGTLLWSNNIRETRNKMGAAVRIFIKNIFVSNELNVQTFKDILMAKGVFFRGPLFCFHSITSCW